MENKLPETINTNSAVSQLNDSVNVDSSDLAKLGSDYIPILSIAYSLSESVDKGIARPGEFVLAKATTLGSEMECIVLAYRLHAALINTEAFSFVESQYVQMGEATPQTYKAFVAMTPPASHEIQEGADLFLYIPRVDSFATIFMKKTLARCVQPIWQQGKGGRLVRLRTEIQKNRTGSRKWYTVSASPTQRALDVSKVEGVTKDVKMSMELYTKYNQQFRNPPAAVAETVADVAVDTIER